MRVDTLIRILEHRQPSALVFVQTPDGIRELAVVDSDRITYRDEKARCEYKRDILVLHHSG